MKIIYLFLFLFIVNISTAQEYEFKMCSTEMIGNPDDENGPCVEYFDYFYDYLDHVQIHKPVFHFVNYDYNVEGTALDGPFSIPALQFVCIDDPYDPGYESDNNAFYIAKGLIFWANESFAKLDTSIPGGAVLPNNDFKVRYTDIVDCNDVVIVENESSIVHVSGRLNFRIINLSNESFGAMGQMFTNSMDLKNIGNKIIHPDKAFFEWQYGPLMNHEIGHDFGLCHAQSSKNLCADIPNIEVCSSGLTDPSCGSITINCDSHMKNNTMISGAATQRGFSPCQFTEAFLGMIEPRDWRTTYLYDCKDIIIDKPQETTYIDCDLYVCSRLVVKTGSELVLRGKLIMNQDSEIKVETGARFIIEDGRITGKENSPGYWRGIRLSDGYTDQVPITTSIADYPAWAPSTLYVSSGDPNNCIIEHAEIAIASRGRVQIGSVVATTSLIHLEGVWIKNNEVGVSINNFLNNSSVNAVISDAWFSNNTKDDLIIIASKDIDIRKSNFFMNSLNGITLIDTELSEFNDCNIVNREIGMDILCTYPFHSGFELGDESGISNLFNRNNIGLQIGGGIGFGNTKDLDIFRGIFMNGAAGIQVLGSSGYEVTKSSFSTMDYGIISSSSGVSENLIHCNDFATDKVGIVTLGNNQNLTMHSNEFNMSSVESAAVWRLNGDIFQVQSAEFDPGNFDIALNPPAGNQFFNAGLDLYLSPDGNTVDYLIPQHGEGVQYYPQTASNYNSIDSDEDIVDCPVDGTFNGGTIVSLPDDFVPNDSTDTWQDPIGDPVLLDDYLDYLIDLGGGDDIDGFPRSEITRVRFALYRWVVYMLHHPSNYDLSVIENFVDDDYQRLLVGYYIHMNDPYNADRILVNLPRINEVNQDFTSIQEVNLRRLFPTYYNLNPSYSPTSIELEDVRAIAEKYSENTGYASALYYLYTHEKVYPDFDFIASHPRSESVKRETIAKIDVYPNPTTGSLEISSNEAMDEYALYDSYGRLKHTSILKGSKNYTLDISILSKGLYFIEIKCGSKTLIKKIVKI